MKFARIAVVIFVLLQTFVQITAESKDLACVVALSDLSNDPSSKALPAFGNPDPSFRKEIIFSLDSKWIASLRGQHLAVWNTKTGATIDIGLRGHRVIDFDFNPQGTQVLIRFSHTTRGDHVVQIWTLEPSPKKVSNPVSVEGGMNYFSQYSGEGRWILVGSGRVFQVMDASTGEMTSRELPRTLNAKIDGNYLLNLSKNGNVRVVEIETENQIASYDFDSTNQVFGEIFAARGLVVLNQANGSFWNGQLDIRDLRTLEQRPLKLEMTGIFPIDRVTDPYLSRDGRWVYAYYFDQKGDLSVVWDAVTGKQVLHESLPGTPLGIYGKTIVTVEKSRYYFTMIDNEGFQTQYVDSRGLKFTVAPDGRRAAYNYRDTIRYFEINPSKP